MGDGIMEPMAAEKWTPERRRELTRSALVDSAAELFAERGFHAASLDDIAERAGFTRGAIYSNFENKEELFFAVLERHVNSQLDAFSRLFEQSGGPGSVERSAVAKAWREMMGDEQWAALTLEFRLYALRNPEVRERLAAQERKLRQVMRRFVLELNESSDMSFRFPPEDIVAVIDGASWGLMEQALLDPSQEHVFELFIRILDEGAFERPGDSLLDKS
ncbi:MAG TPA: TetR/AcrR family transcriptional regulator [Acidimicrobiales bacterium]|nr:TetR/AcrR family transcriptional regulator [Acidimicrobiales bacterium]